MRKFFVAVLLACPVVALAAEPYTTYGVMSCAKFMQARASQDQHLENIALIWTAGFATGANSQGATLDSLDNEGILKYLDTFCSTNKDSNIARALTILVGPLQPRASVN